MKVFQGARIGLFIYLKERKRGLPYTGSLGEAGPYGSQEPETPTGSLPSVADVQALRNIFHYSSKYISKVLDWK